MSAGPHLLSLQVGLPRSYGTAGAAERMDRLWTTGFYKEPVAGPVWLGALGLAGDGQADRKNHGGPEKAVLAYAAAHYPTWSAELGREFPFGGFGENLTVAGATEESVCIGDVWQVGSARLQVSQPRGPCWKIGRRWHMKDLAARVQRTGRTGWYLRVLNEGEVSADEEIVLLERPFPEWTVALTNELTYSPRMDREQLARLAECDVLAPNWREKLHRSLAGEVRSDPTARLVGPNDEEARA